MKKDIYKLLSKRDFRFPRLTTKITFSFFLVLLGLLFTGGTVFGQTVITWCVDTTIHEEFQVDIGTTLKICPGVTVTFENINSKLIVYGNVEAVGTLSEPIVFKGLDVASYWKGINLISGTVSSKFKYCEFYNIQRNQDAKVEKSRLESGIDISMSDNIEFKHCYFKNNRDGIGAINSSNLLIDSCTFKSNIPSNLGKGLIAFEINTSAIVSNNVFSKNECNHNGIITIRNGCDIQVLKNIFTGTKFIPDGELFYSIIYATNTDYTNFVVINGNKFIESHSLTESIFIQEIKIKGINNKLDSTNAFIWNNEFRKNPFLPTTNVASRTSIYAVHANISIAHNNFMDFTQGCIYVNYCETKIILNRFETDTTKSSVIKYGNYKSSLLIEDIYNEVIGNTFVNNTIIGEDGGVINSEIYPRLDINLTTLIENNIFYNNKSYYFDDDDNTTIFNGGAAIYDKNNSFMSIVNNTFELGSAYNGGAISIKNLIGSKRNDVDGLATIKNNEFVNNIADSLGGAIYVDSASVLIQGNLLANNTATRGGAIFTHYLKSSTIENNAIVNNYAKTGGGIYCSHSYANTGSNKVIIVDNTIQNNTYENDGGGIYVDLFASNNDTLKFLRNMVSFNKGAFGIENLRGGGAYISQSKNVEFLNCNFFSNVSTNDYAGVYVNSSVESSCSFINCDIINHDNEGGIFFSPNTDPEKVMIYNTIFSGNNISSTGKGIMYESNSSNDIITYNCYFDVLPGNYDVTNIDFVQAIMPGFIFTNDFHLNCENSVCIDTGYNSIAFKDLTNSNPPPEVLWPSCGSDRNDIGISGGPWALDAEHIFVPQAPELKIDFVARIVDSKTRRIKIVEKYNNFLPADVNFEYRWLLGDGNYTDYMVYNGSLDYEYAYSEKLESAIITLVVKKDGVKNICSQVVNFNEDFIEDGLDDVNKKHERNNVFKIQTIGSDESDDFVIYPNPSQGEIFIKVLSKSDADFSVEINDMTANVVCHQTMNGSDMVHRMDLSEYGKGLFVITIKANDHTFIKKIVIR